MTNELTAAEVTARLGISMRSLNRARRAGRIVPSRILGEELHPSRHIYYYDAREVERYAREEQGISAVHEQGKLTQIEVARKLGVTVHTIRAAIARGELTAHRISDWYFAIAPDDAEEYARRRKFPDLREAGRRIGVSHTTIWKAVQRGQLRAYRHGRNYRIDPDDLRHFAQSNI